MKYMYVHYMQKYTGTLKPVYFGTCVIRLTVLSDADSFLSFIIFSVFALFNLTPCLFQH